MLALAAGLGLLAFPWVFQQPYPRDVMIRVFLYARMYRHWSVQRMRRKARHVVEHLFATFTEAPELMPHDWNACAALDATARARVVADYIAGMTDRFALQEHSKLTDPMVNG